MIFYLKTKIDHHGMHMSIGGNPLSFATEIIIEIKQFYSGRMASHASIESIWCIH